MVLKHWILPNNHFKTHLFFSIFGWGGPFSAWILVGRVAQTSKLSGEAIWQVSEGVDPLTRVPLTRGYFWPEFFWPESHWPEVFWPEDFWPEGSFDQRVYLTRGSIDQRFFWPELLSTRDTQCIIFDQRIKKMHLILLLYCVSLLVNWVDVGGVDIYIDKHKLQLQLQLTWKLSLLFCVSQFFNFLKSCQID